jgi:putative transposase
MLPETLIHNRKSNRLKGYDYSKEGTYFLTICTENHKRLFGYIENKKMILNDAGKTVIECWLAIPAHFPNVKMCEYVVMPNHIHGIIEILGNGNSVGANYDSPKNINPDSDVGANNDSPLRNNNVIKRAKNISPQRDVPMQYGAKNISPPPIRAVPQYAAGFQSPSGTIGSIVRGFKIGVVKWFITNQGIKDVWQRNYYDHIIRDYDSYKNIADYIIANPAQWEKDKFFIN